MTEKRASIAEAPTVADVASAPQRVGTVDFSSTLLVPAVSEGGTDDTTAPLTSMVRAPHGPSDETADAQPRMPFILPPAKVDAAMAVEAERVRLAVATARGELPQDAPVEELEDEAPAESEEPSEDEDEDASETEPEAPVEVEVTEPEVTEPESTEPEVTEPQAPEPEAGAAGLQIQSVADLDELAAQREAEAARVAAAEPVAPAAPSAPVLLVEPVASIESVLPVLPVVEAIERVAHVAPVAPPAQSLATRDESPESAARVREVADVAAGVIAAMRRINVLHERHVEALEIEAARRCELLTAQAELDAELIRLHARREAHAIISAATTQGFDSDATPAPSDHLGAIGETFARFAETIETTAASNASGTHDHLRTS